MDQWNKTMQAVVATSAVGTKTKKTRNNQRTARQNKAKKKGGNVLVQDVESQRQWREARLDRLEGSYDLILDTTLNDELNLSDESDYEHVSSSSSSESDSDDDGDEIDEEALAAKVKARKLREKEMAKEKSKKKKVSAATKKKGRGGKKTNKKKSSSFQTSSNSSWEKVTSLSVALLDDRNSETVARYVRAEAVAKKPLLPPRHFCPVTGLPGIYTDTKSSIRFSGLGALEQLREREPPWLTNASGGGDACYYEAMKSLHRSLGKNKDADTR